MRLTIVRADGLVIIDGSAKIGLDLSDLPADVHAVQWYDTHGVVELVSQDGSVSASEIDELGVFQTAVDKFLGDAPDAPPALTAEDAKYRIDFAAGQIVRDVVGDRAEEYRQAEEEAKAWAGSGYTGPAPASVQVWATAAGITPRQSCDSIITQAQVWRGALVQIRSARLMARATAESNPEAAIQQWSQAEGVIRSQLGV